MSTTAIQVNLSLISVSESEVTKKLASYGALFAVPTAIAGIYGMNFKFMPELDWIWGYPLTLALIVLADALLWLRFRKAKWL
jgi:magnesium transporter